MVSSRYDTIEDRRLDSRRHARCPRVTNFMTIPHWLSGRHCKRSQRMVARCRVVSTQRFRPSNDATALYRCRDVPHIEFGKYWYGTSRSAVISPHLRFKFYPSHRVSRYNVYSLPLSIGASPHSFYTSPGKPHHLSPKALLARQIPQSPRHQAPECDRNQ